MTRRLPNQVFLATAAVLLAGLAALARAEFLLFILGAAVWLLLKQRSALLYLAGAALLILPVTLHNTGHGAPVLIASSGGENLYSGRWHGPRRKRPPAGRCMKARCRPGGAAGRSLRSPPIPPAG